MSGLQLHLAVKSVLIRLAALHCSKTTTWNGSSQNVLFSGYFRLFSWAYHNIMMISYDLQYVLVVCFREGVELKGQDRQVYVHQE